MNARRLLSEQPWADAGSSRHVVDATFSATACIAVRRRFGSRLNPPHSSTPGGSLVELRRCAPDGRI